MEKKGVPTVTICSDEFATLGQAEAEALGMPALPIAVIPHPLAGLLPPDVEKRAKSVVDEVAHILTAPKDKLAQEYKGKYSFEKGVIRKKSVFG